MTPARPDYVSDIVDELAYDYGESFSRDEVEETVAGVWQRAKDAKVALHLTVLVENRSRELLAARAQAEGRVAKKAPELLFICVRNEGRSQLAAALAEHLSAHKVHVRSAGTRPTGAINPVVVQSLAERGITLDAPYPKPVHTSVVDAADVIVTMGVREDEAVYRAGATSIGTYPIRRGSP